MAKRKNKKEKKNAKNLQLLLVLVRYYKLLTIVIVITVVAFGYTFILEPKYREISSGGQYNLETVETELAKRETYLDTLKTLVTNYQNISQAEINKLKKVLPEEKDLPGIFVQFEALAQEYDLFLSSISINEVAEEVKKEKSSRSGKIKKLNVSLSLISIKESHDYADIKEFLSALENNLRLLDVNAVYFSPDALDYSVNLFTYYY